MYDGCTGSALIDRLNCWFDCPRFTGPSLAASHESVPVQSSDDRVMDTAIEEYDESEDDGALMLEGDVASQSCPSFQDDSWRSSGVGSSTVYKVEGKPVAVPQHVHYAFRSAALAALSLYEYAAMVVIVPKPKPKAGAASSSSDAVDTVPADGEVADRLMGSSSEAVTRGRKRSLTVDFDAGHPLCETHTQRLCSKQFTPILAGAHCPKYPGPKPLAPSAQWSAAAARFARYVLVTFRPWSVESKLPGSLDWDSLCDFMESLEHPADPATAFVGLSVAKVISNVASSLYVNAERMHISSSYRARAAEIVWEKNGTVLTGSRSGSGEFSGDDDEAVREIERLVAATKVKKLAREATSEASRVYVENQLNQLKVAFSAGLLESGGGCGGGRDGGVVKSDVLLTRTHEESSVKNVAALLEVEVHDAPDAVPSSVDASGDSEVVLAADESVDSVVDPSLNAGQAVAVRRVARYITQLQAWKRSPTMFPKPKQLLMLVHGPPGVGKTYFIEQLDLALQKLGNGMTCSAFTGIASSKLPRPRTLHMTLVFGRKRGRAGKSRSVAVGDSDLDPGSEYNKRLPAMAPDTRLLAQQRLDGKDVFLIDEVSMIGPVMLGHVDQRLREITNVAEPFGGKAVVLCGDFFQLPPTVPPTSLYKAVVDNFVDESCFRRKRRGKKAIYLAGTPGDVGTDLFRQFQLVSLTQQQRAAGDPVHCNTIAAFRDVSVDYPVSSEVLSRFRELSAEDVKANLAWLFCPIIVTSNLERQSINMAQAQRFSLMSGVPMLTWRLSVAADLSVFMDSDLEDVLYAENPSMYGMFVQGATAYITSNIARSYGVVNGTCVRMHSLTFAADTPSDVLAEIRRLIRAAQPGQMVELPIAPESVNVELEDKNAASWPSALTLVPGKVVIPVVRSRESEEVQLCGTFQGVIRVKPHPVDLGFSLTFHKVQGQTLDRVIVDLNDRPFRPAVDFFSLYVAISRVRRGCDIRVLPLQPGQLRRIRLLSLQPPEELRLWLSCFNESGEWCAPQARTVQPEPRAAQVTVAPGVLRRDHVFASLPRTHK